MRLISIQLAQGGKFIVSPESGPGLPIVCDGPDHALLIVSTMLHTTYKALRARAKASSPQPVQSEAEQAQEPANESEDPTP